VNTIDIVPIAEDHIESYHRMLDVIARERRYLSLLEAPLEETRSYVRHIIEHGYPQLVALAAGEVVGWRDMTPKSRPARAHAGVLGMGVLQPFRGRGIGTRLLQRTLDASRTSRLQLIKARLQEPSLGGLAGQLQRSLVGRPRCVCEA
jgi:GNAT superfamily N-acetyltransferase